VLDDAQGSPGENALALKHAFLKAYFTDGQDPSSHDVLARYAAEAGLDADQAREVLTSGRYAPEVREREQYYQQRGIHSVPSIIIDGKHLIQGGQPVEVFEQALRQIAANPAG
jgi:predicted DsbA family dithiol-disulfide isomerase